MKTVKNLTKGQHVDNEKEMMRIGDDRKPAFESLQPFQQLGYEVDIRNELTMFGDGCIQTCCFRVVMTAVAVE